MITRIEISSKIFDTREVVKKKYLNSIGFKIKSIFLVDVYTIDKNLSRESLEKIGQTLSNPITQKYTLRDSVSPKIFSYCVEIGFLPGVTDNVATTAKEIAEDLLKTKFSIEENIYTSQVLFVEGNLSKEEIKEISENLYNPLIQRAQILSFQEFTKNGGIEKVVPKVKLTSSLKVDKVNLDVSDEELIAIGKMGIKNSDGTKRGPLALDLTYMKAIQEYFNKSKRQPTDIELESIAQTWSEHCKHTIFSDPIDEIKNGLYKSFIRKATEQIRKKKGKKDFCVSVFTDNSGAIEFDDKYLITHKVETHNSPSALDPFGGAITGIVGVNRDAIGFGLGAKPIANTYGFCFANPNNNTPLFRSANLTQKILSPRRIMEGVIAGVNSGGNCSGIPTPLGLVYFDKRFRGKPLVFVGTVGLIPKRAGFKKAYQKRAMPGDLVVMVGGRVGQDGIHGATFSSEALESGSPATAVQIGDPITQKKLSDAIVKEARDRNLYNSITDNGAGGLSCSVAEMAKECGGTEIDLEKIPLKYPGLEPWKIWISESQERMTLAIPTKSWEDFYKLMKSRGVEASVIGKFTNSGKCIVKVDGKTIMDVDMDFLHNGLPERAMKTIAVVSKNKDPSLPKTLNLNKFFLKMLKSLNITSTEFISTQYDHEVQGNSILKPLQGRGKVNADSAVIRPSLQSSKGLVISESFCPSYSDIDTYNMAAASIDGAIRSAVAAGANINNLALVDNFCWSSSNNPERLWQLREATRACYDVATVYETPFISGKDSMFNDFKGYDDKGNEIKISAPPTLMISTVGVINDVTKAVSLDAKFSGDLIYVLGDTFDEMGGSQYFKMLDENAIGTKVPKVDAKKNLKLYKSLIKSIEKGLITSAQSLGFGGLAAALAKTLIGGGLGANISLKNLSGDFSRDDFALFSESQGRILVTVNPKNRRSFEKIIKGSPISLLGKVSKMQIINIKNKFGKSIVNISLQDALKAYKSTFKDY